ncbi:alpha/beta hydrolase [Reyranella sp. CPCC 100927]|uniref:alpha/beta hydrolase n=1 Tax=Reyranella sp. CPCC 100927 TaxID=2599616 RepID=UPI0011B4B450|nr:alpha/beta fold hydrolase [Reyranella sp. CPCC 100927]TWT05623.1 alpha/beta fold hydrolase [Reyranella sp. CPCC 100927]
MNKPVIIWSEGSRLAADLFLPDEPHGRRLPAILLCHGWGGLKSHLAVYARRFARHGFACLVFDYRGWGESDGRIVAPATGPMLTTAGTHTLDVRVVREIVDPIDQLLDIRNAFEFLAGEDVVDTARMAIWGTSYGGGHAVHFTSIEDRVRCVVAQIGGYDHPQGDDFKQLARSRAQKKARGEFDPALPQGVDTVPGLKGTPDVAKMLGHRAVRAAANVRVPSLIIDAEHEELVDRSQHGRLVYETIRQNAPADYITYPCTHYGVYDAYYEPSSQAAVAWFHKHLVADGRQS